MPLTPAASLDESLTLMDPQALPLRLRAQRSSDERPLACTLSLALSGLQFSISSFMYFRDKTSDFQIRVRICSQLLERMRIKLSPECSSTARAPDRYKL